MTDSKVILWHGKLILCNQGKVRERREQEKNQNNEDIYILDISRALLDRKDTSFLDVLFPRGLSAIDLCCLGNCCLVICLTN